MRIRSFQIIGFNCEQYGKNQYLNVTDTLIIQMIFTFLCCHEKAHDNKKFS